MPRSCSCGSGLPRFPLFDARAIFLAYACDKCERAKLAKYRPEVLTDPNYAADEAIDPE